MSMLLVCDGKRDCPNGEDENESFCQSTITDAKEQDESMFQCSSELRWVESTTLCDGRIDCRDGYGGGVVVIIFLNIISL